MGGPLGRRLWIVGAALAAACVAESGAEPRGGEPAAPEPLHLDAPALGADDVPHGPIGPPARAAESPRLQVIELPPEGLPGEARRRPHHAMVIGSEAPKSMLRSIGVHASDCATRVRMPSSLHQTAGGTDLEGRVAALEATVSRLLGQASLPAPRPAEAHPHAHPALRVLNVPGGGDRCVLEPDRACTQSHACRTFGY